MKTMFGFEARVDGVWSAEACGEQDASNYFDTEAGANEEIWNLARVMDCSVLDLRVVAVEVQS